jgi:hypothetical protein
MYGDIKPSQTPVDNDALPDFLVGANGPNNAPRLII